MELELQYIDRDLAIAKLEEIPDLEKLIAKAEFVSFTKTGDEFSLVIDTESAPPLRFVNTGWNAFKIIGQLDFSLVGILQQVIDPLTENGVSIFALSTFETDYILVKKEQAQTAVSVLSQKFKISGFKN